MPKFTIRSSDYRQHTVRYDDEDASLVETHRWYLEQTCDGNYYAYTHIGRASVALHSLICDVPAGMEVDHINHKTLDNRRSNLRIVTHQENMWNSQAQRGRRSKYKGVHYIHRRKAIRSSKPWRACITKDGKRMHLGTFATSSEAARAYDDAAYELFGPHACLNFPKRKVSR